MNDHRTPPRKHPKPKPRNKENRTEEDKEGRPTNYELEQAINTAEKMKRYLEQTEPHATFNIERLQIAMDELSTHTVDEEE